jgi:site-specific DNA recombinase
MTPAVIYARVSSREQQQEGYSIPAQLKLLHAYASKNGFEIIEEFVDVETAKTIGRKNFSEMAKFLKSSRNCRTVLVEKTDRLYRNFDDSVFLEKLDIEIHFVKTGNVLSKNAKAQTKFMHGIEVVSAKYYVDNLREEVIKGMREKAEQGIFPGHAPFGYVNNRMTRAIDIHPEESELVKLIFNTYATGKYSLSDLRKYVSAQTGKKIARSYVHQILRNRFYIGFFEWGGDTFLGKQETYISKNLFDTVQAFLDGHNRPRYQKHELAFRGLLTCAHDGCTVTAELKKQKYVYYRCSGHRGKCELPRFREQEISAQLGTILKDIYIPDEVRGELEKSLQRAQASSRELTTKLVASLERKLSELRSRMDKAYDDKLAGRLPEEFWQRKLTEWTEEEQRLQCQIKEAQSSKPDQSLTLNRILELANKAYFLYLTRKPAEQAELLRKVLLNCSIDGVSVTPTYRKPFDIIFNRVKNQEWSGREDLNLRPPGPEFAKGR